ncbi:uncharacterized protein BT62DRAFT_285108 [Guyanagaster necrorhizus]|uniref:BHLH domain-containing protein n=1 Tax=Guyanagaster necrorhizus TaxID=856835 RepID=A0A9P8AZP5_9AGAR|nr:uncharacterized protein BT62DRAFT_285108 [Guyanagaster necrorhizus MCA 3950]KAG7452152.1 hypothetical protein BT62DRAFT_285108 [Guyanagaster necrorhizus MCA 3950]
MDDFAFTFDHAHLVPIPPPLPPSADLFSPAETTDLLGFLDTFTAWDASAQLDTSFLDSMMPFAPQPQQPIPQIPKQPPQAPPQAPQPQSQSQPQPQPPPPSQPPPARTKSLLSTPQKRLNHIMSEQKRRNAIRDGYAQLITLLAAGGSEPTIPMPSRGRPKGSGANGGAKGKGKSGVLLRAVDYVRWLEQGRDALKDEVARVEAAAGIQR